jgi:hypothetical protein
VIEYPSYQSINMVNRIIKKLFKSREDIKKSRSPKKSKLAEKVVEPILNYLKTENPHKTYSARIFQGNCETEGNYRKVVVYGDNQRICSIKNSYDYGTSLEVNSKSLSKTDLGDLLDSHKGDYIDLMWSNED